MIPMPKTIICQFRAISAREGQDIFAAHPDLVRSYTRIEESFPCEIARYVDTWTIDWRPNVTRVSIGPDYAIKFWGGDITDIRPVSGDVPLRRVFELKQQIVSVGKVQSGIEPANANLSGLQQLDRLSEFCLGLTNPEYPDGLKKDGSFVTHSIRPIVGALDIVSWGFERYDDRVEKIYARARNGVVGRLMRRPYQYFRIDRETLERFYTADDPAPGAVRTAEIIPFPTSQGGAPRLVS